MCFKVIRQANNINVIYRHIRYTILPDILNITEAQARVLRAIAYYEAKSEQKGATQYTCSEKVPNEYHVSGSTFNDNIKKLQEKLMVLELKGTKKTKPNTTTDIGQIAWLRFFPIEKNIEIIQEIFPNILISEINDIINEIQNPDIKLIKNKFAQSVLKIALNQFHIEQNITSYTPFHKSHVEEIIDFSSCYDLIKTSFKREYTITHPLLLDGIKKMYKEQGADIKKFKNYDDLEISAIDRITFLFYYILIQSVSDDGYAGKVIPEIVMKKLIKKEKGNMPGYIGRYLKLSLDIPKKKNKIMKIITSNNTVNKIIEKNFEQLKEYKNTDFQEISDFFIKN